MTDNADQLIEPALAENYRALLADENRALTPERLAAQAEASGSTNLAAWARAQAAAGGADVTPTDATPEPPATTRGDDAPAETDDELDDQIASDDEPKPIAKPAPAKPSKR